MLWLVPAFIASAVGCWYAWSRGMQLPGVILVAVAIGLLVLIGRRLEAGRAAEWEQAARDLHATYRGAQPASFLATFGSDAPWVAWASDGELQCPHVIDASAAEPPFQLLQIRYSKHERRGEEHPDSWYEVSVAALPLRGAPGTQPKAIENGEYVATSNGNWLFVWKKGPRGAGQPLPTAELPGLVQHARELLTRLSPAAPAR